MQPTMITGHVTEQSQLLDGQIDGLITG